jgi:hypothetical protein
MFKMKIGTNTAAAPMKNRLPLLAPSKRPDLYSKNITTKMIAAVAPAWPQSMFIEFIPSSATNNSS